MKLVTDSRVRTFVVLTLLFLASRTADAATTYMVTPDLSREYNPLVRIFGAGWRQLLFAQAVMIALVVGLAYWDLFFSPLPHPQERGLSFRDFADIYYFARRVTATDYLWRLPRGWRMGLKMAGYVLPRALIILGFYVAASTFMSIHSALWRQVLRLTFPAIYYVPMVLVILWSAYGFLRREFRSYVLTAMP